MTQKISTPPSPPLVPPQFTPAEWARIVKVLRLPPQQANVAALVLQSRPDKQIARELGLSEETVNNYLRAIFARLDIHDRVALAVSVFNVAMRIAKRAFPPERVD